MNTLVSTQPINTTQIQNSVSDSNNIENENIEDFSKIIIELEQMNNISDINNINSELSNECDEGDSDKPTLDITPEYNSIANNINSSMISNESTSIANTNENITHEVNTIKNLKIGVKNEDDLKYSLEHNNDLTQKGLSNIKDTKDDKLASLQNKIFDNNIQIDDKQEDLSSGLNENEVLLMESHDESTLSTENSFSDEISKASNSDELSDNILEQIKTGLKNSSTPRNMNIMLKPQQLGNVNVKIKFSPTGMHIEIIVDSDIAENAIMNNLSKLEHIISPNNDLNIASINISQRKERQIKEKQIKEYSLELKNRENLISSKRVNPIYYKK